MKNLKFTLFTLALIFYSFSAYSDVSLSITGKALSCPNRIETYTIQTSYCGLACQAGVSDYESVSLVGYEVENGTVLSVSGSLDNTFGATLTIQWNNSIGIGKLKVHAEKIQIAWSVSAEREYEVYIGSPQVGEINSDFTFTCVENRGQFSVPSVPGVSQYNWSNSVGHNIISSNSNTIIYDFSSPTARNFTLNVSVVNSNCPVSNSSTSKNFYREQGYTGISGSEFVIPRYKSARYNIQGYNATWSVSNPSIVALSYYGTPMSSFATLLPNNTGSSYFSVSYTDFCGISHNETSLVEVIEEESREIASDEESKGIVISPNPTEKFINIYSDEDAEVQEAEIRNVDGKIEGNFSLHNTRQVPISDLPAGTHILFLKGKDGKIFPGKKFLKK